MEAYSNSAHWEIEIKRCYVGYDAKEMSQLNFNKWKWEQFTQKTVVKYTGMSIIHGEQRIRTQNMSSFKNWTLHSMCQANLWHFKKKKKSIQTKFSTTNLSLHKFIRFRRISEWKMNTYLEETRSWIKVPSRNLMLIRSYDRNRPWWLNKKLCLNSKLILPMIYSILADVEEKRWEAVALCVA